METDEAETSVVVLKLSTGYLLPVDLDKRPAKWLSHLGVAVIGERLLPETTPSGDLPWHIFGEELRFLLVTTPPIVKDALLMNVMLDSIRRQLAAASRRGKRRAKSAQ